jgi:lipopolysaccharide/colanic/teichoic acid biosynthesis glycosyltransferase
LYTPLELVIKRALDVAGAAVGLVATAPLLAVSAVLVKLSSPGPTLFRQVRIGRGGCSFELIKFRTMHTASTGPEITSGGDPRITRIGRILRKTKLDELPTLVNVLRGDLALVGPRPEVPRYVALYPEPERELLQRFRPGITDPATIRFRNEEEILARAADPEEAYVREVLPLKIGMYRAYLEGASLRTDLCVLVATARVVLFPRAAPL